jgi:hypothetical protein
MESMNVPELFETQIADGFHDAMDDLPENYGGCVDTQVNEICHTSYDGFIPFTNGGFDLTVPTDLRSMWGSGSGPSNEAIDKELQRVIETSQQDALEQFVQDKREELSKFFTDAQLDDPKYDDINYHDLYEMDQGQLAEDLSQDYEDLYLSEGGVFFYQMRAMYFAADNCRNESGKDEILFLAGVNMDFEYGRDSGLEVTYEKNIPVGELTIDSVETIIKDMVASI